MHSTEPHFKLPVRAASSDTDKWWRRRTALELGDAQQSDGNLLFLPQTLLIYIRLTSIKVNPVFKKYNTWNLM
ncbi:hypothetical protein EYF80_035414 [Liparis tanakae]|uniref:Uncharacterized protein n=1 Tax=Liparis tanakae TaxID=230148 RepID=A0A4Z2GLM5_9TELE|nr:hypothetical protein EYF80_035414 [Liparis tanakae]